MNRRGFFKAIGTLVLGATIALRTIEKDESYLPPVEDVGDTITVRYPPHWDVQCGYAMLRPNQSIRVISA